MCTDSLLLPQNGYLMSTFAIVRAMFLTFAFPPIIEAGRKWYASASVRPHGPSRGVSYSSTARDGGKSYGTVSHSAHNDDDSGSISSSSSESSEENEGHAGFKQDSEHHAKFDLDFLRWSCLFDAIMTGVLAFSQKSWQMYIGTLSRSLKVGNRFH